MAINKVLLVDDDPNIRVVAQIALEDVGGWTVLTVDSGTAALALLAEVRTSFSWT